MRARSLLVVVLVSAAGVAGAQPPPDPSEPYSRETGEHCGPEGRRARWVLHQQLLARTNPEGAMNTLRFGLCTSLVTGGGEMFDLSKAEIGVFDMLTPVYNIAGLYTEVVLASPLVLRLELGGIYHWHLPTDRIGYHEVQGYDADYRDRALPEEEGGNAHGLFFGLTTVFRLRFPLGNLAAVAFDALQVEFWKLGEGDFYVNLRADAITSRTDWVLANEAVLALEIPFPVGTRHVQRGLRIGAYDSLRRVRGSDYRGNEAGLVTMLFWRHPGGRLHDFSILARGGLYTEHAFRGGEPAFVLGAGGTFDLGEL